MEFPEPTLETERLLLRPWRPADLAPFAALNADPLVVEHLLGPLTRTESDGLVERLQQRMREQGFGFWAVEVKDGPGCIGFLGLTRVTWDTVSPPRIEIGWRLAADQWGKGYATEGARAALAHGFDVHKLDQIISFTTVANQRSQAVMQRLGMTRDPADDFDHPVVPGGHPAKRHVLYRMSRAAFLQQR